ncbi:MAG: RNA polymerase sigma-70 factor (ECF subfamily) [Cyclobacteriaceae bacterium]|jgi:RNA polymerase sigma-70 factor (ECF subfamily)
MNQSTVLEVVKNKTDTAAMIRKIKSGDQQAASALYERYYRAMYNTILRMVSNENDAKDLLQEGFIKAFRYLGGFKGTSTLGAWLKRIMINTALEQLRKHALSYSDVSAEDDVMIDEIEQDNWGAILSDVQQVHCTILELPDGTRNVVTLYLLEGYTHDEIGAYLGISPATSKTQYMRGKKLIKDKMKAHYETRSF